MPLKSREARLDLLDRWKESHPTYHADYRREHRSEARDYNLRTKYGITLLAYTILFASQDGLCAICRQVCKHPAVDHDHVTGEIRGILCGNCNRGIGLFRDDPVALQAAAKYLGGAE